MMCYVYILYSNILDKMYVGSTGNLKNRLDKHNLGKVKSTKSGKPWKLIYYEGFVNKTDCRREELFLKTGKGRDRVKYMLMETRKSI